MDEDFDFFGADIWGADPEWAKSDGGGGGDDENGDVLIGAQHVLILLDCHSDMFQSIKKNKNSIAEEEDDSDNDNKEKETKEEDDTDGNEDDTTTTKPEDEAVAATTATFQEEIQPFEMGLQLTQKLLQHCIRNVVTLKTGKRNCVGLILYHTKPMRKKSKKKKGDGDSDSMTDADNQNKDDKKDDSDDSDSDSGSDDDDEEETETVHKLIDLSPPGVDQVKTIRRCLPVSPTSSSGGQGQQQQQRRRRRDLQDEFGANPNMSDRIAPLQTALETSMRMFRERKEVKDTKPGTTKNNGEKVPVDTKSIWILTNRDDPYPDYSTLIQNVASDAKEEGIRIDVWPLPTSKLQLDDDDEFDYEPFFDDIISSSSNDDQPTFPNRFTSTEDILEALEDMQELYKVNRRTYSIPMILPDWRKHQRQQEEKSSSSSSSKKDSSTTTSSDIMTDWFRCVRHTKKPNPVTIDQETKREVVKIRQYSDSQAVILASFKSTATVEERSRPQPGMKRLRQFAKFGDDLIPMTKEDIAELRYQANGQRSEPGLILLGFKPIDSVPFWHSVDVPYFIFPNDDYTVTDTGGSTTTNTAAFKELHASMLRKKVLAIGEVLFRPKIWRSKLVAVIPLGEEEVQEDGDDDDEDEGYGDNRRRPPGMMVLTLPFEDDMRAMELDAAMKELLVSNDLGGTENEAKKEGDEESQQAGDVLPPEVPSSNMEIDGDGEGIVTGNVASSELVDAAVSLIEKLRLQDMTIGENFTNAAMEDFFNYLEAVALELPAATEEPEYDTRPLDDTILNAARTEIEGFLRHLPQDVVPEPKAKATRKRKIVPDETGLDWEDLYQSDTLDSCKMDQLKSFLRSKGEPTTGRKADLVLAVANYLRAEQGKRKKAAGGVKTEMET